MSMKYIHNEELMLTFTQECVSISSVECCITGTAQLSFTLFSIKIIIS